MFRQLVQSEKMDDEEDPRLEDEHFSELRQKEEEEDLQRAATYRYQRLKKELESLIVLLKGDNGVKKNESIKKYIDRIEMDAYATTAATGLDTKTLLAKSNLFQRLEKIKSILEEYFSVPTTLYESTGLEKFINKYPCNVSDGLPWLTTKKWDFVCTQKGGISSSYIEKYIARVYDFFDYLQLLEEDSGNDHEEYEHEEKRDRDYGYGGGDRYDD
jgi:hypothetical protein